MSTAKKGDFVKVHYKGTLDDGSVFDSSEGRDPLAFVLGAGQMIQGFDEGVLGMELNETKTVTMPPEKAYGITDENLIMDVPKDQLPADFKPQIGEKLQAQMGDGKAFIVTVKEVADEFVTIDANHELAGKKLTFEITLVQIGE